MSFTQQELEDLNRQNGQKPEAKRPQAVPPKRPSGDNGLMKSPEEAANSVLGEASKKMERAKELNQQSLAITAADLVEGISAAAEEGKIQAVAEAQTRLGTYAEESFRYAEQERKVKQQLRGGRATVFSQLVPEVDVKSLENDTDFLSAFGDLDTTGLIAGLKGTQPGLLTGESQS